jgi:hypothetical protein
MDEPTTVPNFDEATVHNRTANHPGDVGPDGIGYDEYYEFKRELTDDLGPIAESEVSIFIVGPYNPDSAYDSLQLAKEKCNDYGEAYLLDDIIDEWDYWTTKFKVVASFSSHILGVYPNGNGGHVWEAGYLDHPPLRDRTSVMKRDYDKPPKEEPFDPMFAHFMKALKHEPDTVKSQYYEWSPEGETDAQTLEDALDDYTSSLLPFHI